MNTENQGTSNGWPLGLEIMTVRLQIGERLSAAPVMARGPYSFHLPSSSFSSFSSSNLDTESTTSFFKDHSVSLGKLIGLRTGERGRLYFTNSIQCEQRERLSVRTQCADASVAHNKPEMSPGICVPLLLCALVKTGRTRNRSQSRSQSQSSG
ncbi:uncharacterized protein LOC110817807 [Carica papaya]|uniref:uncharacterized protein LOC110817807 n=1 Tax=Carica papaya TaxID=3649 RepID=UPI000B8C93A5|nr:uncharacterized protein LOC110817807 [Carica papaya]